MNKTLTEVGQKSNNSDSENGTVYRASGSLFIVKKVHKGIPKAFLGRSRGNISTFSPGSGLRMRRYLRECLAEYTQMVTLTYPEGYPTDGRIVKEHLRRFLQELKREYDRHVLACDDKGKHSSFWFLEFQQRGAPHFHIFTTWAPKPRHSGDWVAKRWYEIVNSEDIRHLQAGTRTEVLKTGRAGTISYASKYAAKMEQKECPEGYENVGRWWGITGRRGVMSAATYISHEDSLKSDIKNTKIALREYVNKQIFTGNMESYKREPGVYVAFIHRQDVMRRIRGYISLLSCKTGIYECIFNDAELSDGGE